MKCDYCGFPFKVAKVCEGKRVFCCAGCAVADRVLTEDGNFPVTPELVLALLGGFTAFNQVVFGLLGWLMRAEGNEILADRFGWISLGVGGVSILIVGLAQHRASAAGLLDRVVALAAVGLWGTGIILTSPSCAIAGTASWILWGARGWIRPRVAADASDLRSK
ncbi:MAG: hypothetical protein J6386_10105 [Candidatus Synoicihabitans palmerolidicus]|nr:hypothetical protein [Candidatus Synoicihabitans palmerolidicus]